ncbi:Pleiotropic drug resistance protein 3 [Hordeum vulgare]|uniref:ethylene receptor 3-like n=1 Tax=Hordeum vulgare subsp. vulgare TaxID=112509 RepID=UPI000B485E3D|nr:ethylene receptor 3-like [Hordeum vulgare subsp. vulgare]KAE8810168.1 Pleiotropic drug resistance protein 3 [Hordeum vulgare]
MWQRGRQTCCRGGTSWGASAAVLFARISRTGRLQFGASIVVCGLTHLLAAFTYEPHSFVLVLLLTVAKCVTALVSFLTAITPLRLRLRLIPKQRSCSASRSASACSGSKPASSTS